LFLIINQLNIPAKTRVLPIKTQSGTVPNVVARVGEYQIGLLSGWASPYAEVNLSGQGTNRKTTADENGYFEFTFIPIKKSYGELCLTSIDVNLIPTFPVCLPPVPPGEDIRIIGVLLPPTISLQEGKITAGESTKASGMTFPNSQLDVYLFENNQGFWQTLINPVLTVALPKYKVSSNQNGYFEFSLPGTQPAINRLFAGSFFNPENFSQYPSLPFSPSPQSNILLLTILGSFWPWWIVILILFAGIFFFLFSQKKNLAMVKYQPSCETEIPWGNKSLKISG